MQDSSTSPSLIHYDESPMIKANGSLSPRNFISFLDRLPVSHVMKNESNLTISIDYSKLVFYDRVQAIPILIYVILLFFLGVPGNFFVCYIYYFKWKKKTSKIFIIALAVFDLINNLISLPIEAALLMNYYNFDIAWLCKSSRFITFCMNSASSTVLVGIAADRLMGICYWSKMRPMNVRTAKLIVFAAVVLAIVTSWPSLFIYGTFTITGTSLKTCLYADKYKNSQYSTIFVWYVLCSNFVYNTTLIVLYSIIGRHIFKHGRSQAMLPGNGRTLSHQRNAWPTRRPSGISSTSGVQEEEVFICQKQSLSRENSARGPMKFTWISAKKKLSGSLGDIPSHKTRTGLLVRSASFGSRTGTSTTAVQRSFSSASDGYVINRHYRPGKTTTMLFLVTVVFILSFVPYCIITIFRLGQVFNSLYSNATIPGKIIFHLFLRSYLLSSSLNPLIYNGLNARFRLECTNLIKRVLCVVCECNFRHQAK